MPMHIRGVFKGERRGAFPNIIIIFSQILGGGDWTFGGGGNPSPICMKPCFLNKIFTNLNGIEPEEQ